MYLVYMYLTIIFVVGLVIVSTFQCFLVGYVWVSVEGSSRSEPHHSYSRYHPYRVVRLGEGFCRSDGGREGGREGRRAGISCREGGLLCYAHDGSSEASKERFDGIVSVRIVIGAYLRSDGSNTLIESVCTRCMPRV